MIFDVLIVGNGLTGMRAALAAADRNVTCALVSLVHPVRSHSVAAQGGINAALGNVDPEDSWERHAFDTVKGSDYLADQESVVLFTKSAASHVHELERFGTPFSRLNDGSIAQRPFGGAGAPRTCYAEDRTGHNLLHALYQQCLKREITFLDERVVIELIVKENWCLGILALDLKSGELETLSAKAVIMATGGAGRIFAKSTNALINSGLGIGLAYGANVAIKDMEFVQFHPTTLHGTNILITEGARGEGGYLFNKNGERFMQRYAPTQLELAPRDIVARAIETEIVEGRGIEDSFVYLDLTHLGEKKIDERLPGIKEIGFRFAGIDISKEPLHVQPGQHYTMGGIDCDAGCRSSIPNLFAAGECSCVSVHGANRLGGNSLLETVVFGEIAGSNAAELSLDIEAKSKDRVLGESKEKMIAKIANFSNGAERVGILRTELRELMMDKVGIFRDEEGLAGAADEIRNIQRRFKSISITSAERVFNLELITIFETESMLALALAMSEGALKRQESRGSHFRTDFPVRDDVNFLKHTCALYTPEGPELSYKQVEISRWQPKAREY